MRRFVDGLAKNLRVIAPTEREWIESGKIAGHLATHEDTTLTRPEKFISSVLIALTARRTGAYLVTCNSKDFIAIRRYVGFELICW
jgi:predicted nucleic acid-binding protein